MTLDELIRDVFEYMDVRGQLDELKAKYPAVSGGEAHPNNNLPPSDG